MGQTTTFISCSWAACGSSDEQLQAVWPYSLFNIIVLSHTIPVLGMSLGQELFVLGMYVGRLLSAAP